MGAPSISQGAPLSFSMIPAHCELQQLLKVAQESPLGKTDNNWYAMLKHLINGMIPVKFQVR